jgi:hypothetical protein
MIEKIDRLPLTPRDTGNVDCYSIHDNNYLIFIPDWQRDGIQRQAHYCNAMAQNRFDRRNTLEESQERLDMNCEPADFLPKYKLFFVTA